MLPLESKSLGILRQYMAASIGGSIRIYLIGILELSLLYFAQMGRFLFFNRFNRVIIAIVTIM